MICHIIMTVTIYFTPSLVTYEVINKRVACARIFCSEINKKTRTNCIYFVSMHTVFVLFSFYVMSIFFLGNVIFNWWSCFILVFFDYSIIIYHFIYLKVFEILNKTSIKQIIIINREPFHYNISIMPKAIVLNNSSIIIHVNM